MPGKQEIMQKKPPAFEKKGGFFPKAGGGSVSWGFCCFGCVQLGLLLLQVG